MYRFRRAIALLLLVCLFPFAAMAETDAFLSDDGLVYDDGTLSVRIERDVAFETNIYYAYVTIQSPEQMLTALAAKYPSKKKQTVPQMADSVGAVFAINGDFFNYHNGGIIIRNGELLRKSPNKTRDTLIIDEKGDFHFILDTTHNKYNAFVESFEGTIMQSFAFGPALIIDGVTQTFNYRDKVSCGYPTKAQRLCVCQMDALSYLIVATEGPEQQDPKSKIQLGLSIPELVTLLEAKGVKHAYNLDGGSSTTLYLCGARINAPETKNREVGDIIYFLSGLNAD